MSGLIYVTFIIFLCPIADWKMTRRDLFHNEQNKGRPREDGKCKLIPKGSS